MDTHSSPLFDKTQKLRNGTLNLIETIENAIDLLDSVEPVLQAFIPEENRKERDKNEDQPF